MNVEIGNETLIFLFWEYLFQNFGILSLQCIWILFKYVTWMQGRQQQHGKE